MNGNNVKKHLREFFRGKESEESRRLIDLWYHFFDDRSSKLEVLNNREKEELRNDMFQEIHRAADISDTKFPHTGFNSVPFSKTWRYKLAAGFAVLLLAAVPAFLMISQETSHVPVEYISSSNPAGQSSKLILGDGTTIWLSANSTLRYPKQFESERREVVLQGEAFFDVAKNPNKPFIVHSINLQTRVLGTSFNIRSFADEEQTEITVTTGRVSVHPMENQTNRGKTGNESLALLDPDQQLIYDHIKRKGVTRPVDSGIYTSWKDGQLSFEDHTLEEIARRLERWYGVKIYIENPELKDTRFRITFENNSLEHALRMLQVLKDFEFKIEERKIWIK